MKILLIEQKKATMFNLFENRTLFLKINRDL